MNRDYCRENPDFVEKIIDDKNSKIKVLQKEKEIWQKEREELYKQSIHLFEKVVILQIFKTILY